LLRPSSTFLFEGFRLDGRGLFRCEGGSNFAPVRLGSRGLDILRLLVERAGELVSKEEIIAAVWPKTVVEDGNLTTQISTLRRILSQAGTEGTYIQTVAGRGYCFVAPVTRGDLPLTTVAAPPFKLSDGLVAKVPMAETRAAPTGPNAFPAPTCPRRDPSRSTVRQRAVVVVVITNSAPRNSTRSDNAGSGAAFVDRRPALRQPQRR
jgi:DNA-binding winged helix-turn-helix (wHTH) protein